MQKVKEIKMSPNLKRYWNREILKRIEEERTLLEGGTVENKSNKPKGFAESRSK